jgi:acyl-coenzyme A thioesterase PaaI-like protein
MVFAGLAREGEWMAASNWVGGDFQQPPRTDGGVALCGSCSKKGSCRLGLTNEALDDSGVAHFRLTCPEDYEGGPGVAHGGWTAEVLDEVCGHVPLLYDQMSVTGTLTIKYLKPVPIRHGLEATAWIEKVEGKKLMIAGELRLTSSAATLATASGIWVARDKTSHFAAFERWLAQQENPGVPGSEHAPGLG